MKTLVKYIRRPKGLYTRTDLYNLTDCFARKVMKAFAGKKAVTPVELLVKSHLENLKVGVIMAIHQDDKVVITFAKWDYADKYNPRAMKAIALQRADKWASKPDSWTPVVPFEVADDLPDFIDRAKKYYKGAKFPAWTDRPIVTDRDRDQLEYPENPGDQGC